MITAPEHIGIQSFHRFGNHNKLYLLIVLKGTLTHDFHCIGNRDTFIASSVFCQCTAFNLKIGGRRCRICLRHRKMCQDQCGSYQCQCNYPLFMIHKPSHPLFSLGSCLAQSLLILLHEEYHGQTCKTQRQEPLRMNGISGLRSAVCDCSGCQVVRIHIDHIR